LADSAVCPDLNDQRTPSCRICGSNTDPAGTVYGRFSRRDYSLARCSACGYAFIVDPWLDYAQIYDERYYAGHGADPMVDYRFELERPERTIRGYEWEGIAIVVSDLLHRSEAQAECSPLRWLDYGCGNGCLVRYLRATLAADAFGFDEGSITSDARHAGIPLLGADDLRTHSGTFDVVTAIEVLEHTLEPVAELRRIRSLLRPGGLLFLTTGNAAPYASNLSRWRYVIPEIHISYFEPRTLDRAFTIAGFRPERRALGRGWDLILKLKVLKNLRIRNRSALTDALPARIAAIADRRTRLGDHPVGWAD
jgi:SAM-dependent methyltransferase